MQRDTKPYEEGRESNIRHGKRPYLKGRKKYMKRKKTTTTTTTTPTKKGTELDQTPEAYKSNHSNQCPEQQKVQIIDLN